MKNKLFLTLFLATTFSTFSQVGDNYFISSPSAVAVKKGLLDFRIYHLFGDIAGENGGIDNFYGYDNARDIKFSFDYGVTKNFSIGIARSKGAYTRTKNFILNAKYSHTLLNNLGAKGDGMLLASFYTDATSTTQMASIDSTSETFFPDFTSRLSYNSIGVLQYQNSRWDIMLSGIYNHRNFVAANQDNGTFGIITGAKFALTQVIRIGADVILPLTNDVRPGLTFDFEFDTGGHVFQLYLSQYSGITPDQNLLYGFESIADGEFRFGFMISRPFKL